MPAPRHPGRSKGCSSPPLGRKPPLLPRTLPARTADRPRASPRTVPSSTPRRPDTGPRVQSRAPWRRGTRRLRTAPSSTAPGSCRPHRRPRRRRRRARSPVRPIQPCRRRWRWRPRRRRLRYRPRSPPPLGPERPAQRLQIPRDAPCRSYGIASHSTPFLILSPSNGTLRGRCAHLPGSLEGPTCAPLALAGTPLGPREPSAPRARLPDAP